MSNAQPDVAPTLSKAWWIVAIGAVIAVVLGMIVVLLPGGDPAATPTTTSSSATAATPAPTAVEATPADRSRPAGASVCGLPAGSQAQPTSGPGGEWRDVGSLVAAPQDRKRFGPGRVSATGATTCFAHSPTGAMYAAAAFTAGASDDRLGPEQARAMVLEGPGKQKFIDTMHEPGSGSSDIGHGTVSGYRNLSYAPDQARVSITVTFPDNVFASLTVDLSWRHGDWKVNTLPDGNLPSGEIQVLTTLDGFTPWIPAQGD